MWLATRQFSQWLQRTFGLSFPQFMALAALAAHRQACPMHELTDATFEDPATMSGIIDRLVKMKLVQRTRSETDRRVIFVQATPLGLTLAHQIREVITQDYGMSYAALSDEELARLEQFLKSLLRIHQERYISLQEVEMNVEIEKLQRFMSAPISSVKLESKKIFGGTQ